MARTRRVSKPSFCFVPFIFNLPESSGTLLLPQTEGVSLLTFLFFSFLSLFHSSPTCSLLFFMSTSLQTIFKLIMLVTSTCWIDQNQLKRYARKRCPTECSLICGAQIMSWWHSYKLKRVQCCSETTLQLYLQSCVSGRFPTAPTVYTCNECIYIL